MEGGFYQKHVKASPEAAGSEKPSLLRRSSFVAKVAVVLPPPKYVSALEQAEVKPESNFTWEDMRMLVKKIITESLFGRFYENILLFLSLVSCLEVIYATYLHPSIASDQQKLNVLQNVELGFAMLFCFDWALSLFLAEHTTIFLSR